MSETWFSSDPHYFHKNIIKYCNRPFSSVEEMNEALVERWNSRVKPEDTGYILGDIGFASVEKLEALLKRLQGHKHVILGNHDKQTEQLKGRVFESVRNYREIRINGETIILFHYGQRVWNKSHHGSIQLYGHSHGHLPGTSQSLDVGVDCWDYYPVNFTQIKERLTTLPKYVGYQDTNGSAEAAHRYAE